MNRRNSSTCGKLASAIVALIVLPETKDRSIA